MPITRGCAPLLVMRGGRAPSDPRPDPRRGNGPVRPSPLRLHFSSILAMKSGLARSRRAEALRRESFCQRAKSATGRSAITSDDVDLSRTTRPHRVRGSGCDVTKMVVHTIRGFRGQDPRNPAVTLRRRGPAGLGRTPDFWHRPGMAKCQSPLSSDCYELRVSPRRPSEESSARFLPFSIPTRRFS